MRAVAAVSLLLLCALGAAGAAQTDRPDLPGRWRLVEPTRTQLAQETLTVDAPDELLITQSPFAITIEHPSKPGTHPEARHFEYSYGVSGRIGILPGSNTIDERWAVTHIGTQLMISRSTTSPPDERGVRITLTSGSMWRIESPGRLVIEFGEERKGERPKIATRVYSRVPPQ